MGYSERWCQLCGISFNIGRIRRADEPEEAAWDYSGTGVVESDMCDCEAIGCTNITRVQPEFEYHDGSVREPEEISEHIAGPACESSQGYSGYRISAEEMKECTWIQCLMEKHGDWIPEPGDEDFEISAKYTWVSAVVKSPPSEFEVSGFDPQRHGVSETLINNLPDPNDDMWATPMHPACFELFRRRSMDRLGKVHIDGLRRIWWEDSAWDARFSNFGHSLDIELVNEQFYDCVPGTEYLAANPIKIPGLQGLFESCMTENDKADPVVFGITVKDDSSDPFKVLSPELKLIILLQLERYDVANLRFASGSFSQLPQIYFHHLVLSGMPWLALELKSLPAERTDWYQLWCKLSAADGGNRRDEIERSGLRMHKWWDGDQWQISFLGLSEDDKKQYKIVSSPGRPLEIPKESKETLEAICNEREKAGLTLPKSTELKGLRNRRRIYANIEKILHRIASFEQVDET